MLVYGLNTLSVDFQDFVEKKMSEGIFELFSIHYAEKRGHDTQTNNIDRLINLKD